MTTPSTTCWPGPSRWSGVGTLLGSGSSCVRFVMFHGIGGPNFTAADFERQLLYFSRRFDVVSIDRALEVLDSGQTAQRAQIVLTFDDGLWNHADVVYPLLRKHGLPAVLYVCPGLIEAGSWLWPQEARQRLRSMPSPHREAWAARHRLPASDANTVVESMKLLPNAARVRLLEQIRSETQAFEPSEEQRRQFDVMNWGQLAALDPALVTIGSHTLNHPIMTSLQADELERELQDSRRWLEERLQRPVEHFCYPNGSENTGVRAAAARHYRSAVTTEPGYAHADTDRLGIPRVDGDPRRLKMVWNLHRAYSRA